MKNTPDKPTNQTENCNVITIRSNQSAMSTAPPAPFELFEPADQQVQEFANICGIPDVNAARQNLDYYILNLYRHQYPPAMIDQALRHALLSASLTAIRSNPIGVIESAMARRIEQFSSRALQHGFDVRVMAVRAEAEARGEVMLPPPSTLSREIAKWLADPGEWSRIHPGLNYDHLAEVAEEFVDLHPHAKPITPRDVRKAFEGSRGSVRVPECRSRDAIISEIQDRARAALYRTAYGSLADQLQGRTELKWYSYTIDYAVLPCELVDDLLASHPDVFVTRPRSWPSNRLNDKEARRNELIRRLHHFVQTVGRPGNTDFPANLYGNGLQARVEARAREIANEWCEAQRATDIEETAKRDEAHQLDLAKLEGLKESKNDSNGWQRDQLEHRIADWIEARASLTVPRIA